jgi:hypothetical protein
MTQDGLNLIRDWSFFCKKQGADFDVFNRGIDILFDRDPDGSRPNIAYYRVHGWQALLNAVEAENQPVKRDGQFKQVRV